MVENLKYSKCLLYLASFAKYCFVTTIIINQILGVSYESESGSGSDLIHMAVIISAQNKCVINSLP